MAIRIYSFETAMALKDKIPRLALIRSMQFQTNGYNKERDGYLIVLEPTDQITHIKEIGDDGLFTDDVPNFEYVEAFLDGDQVTFELVYQLDNSRSVAMIIPDEPWLDPSIRNILREASGPPLALVQLQGDKYENTETA